MQYYVTPYTNFDELFEELDSPDERKIAAGLARLNQKSEKGVYVPLIGSAGIPTSGKSML